MSKPVDIQAAAMQTEEFDPATHAEEIAACSQDLDYLFESMWKLYAALDERFKLSYASAGDLEMGLHELFLRDVENKLNELKKRAALLKEFNWRRVGKVMEGRNSEGFVVHGKKFTADGELVPTPPKAADPEYEKFVAHCLELGYKEVIRTAPHWPALKKAVNDAASKGIQIIGVKMSPKLVVKVT